MTQKTFSRRDFLCASALTAAGAALAACCPQPSTEPVIITQVIEKEGEQVVVTVETEKEVVVQATPPPEETVEITFMGWGGTEEDEGVRSAITVFEGAEPNIKVNWLHTPENYAQKMLAMVAAGTPPDTAFIGGPDYRTYCRDGLLLDITDMLKADLVVGAPDSVDPILACNLPTDL
ncbi:MAG: extracellular solute-binding protein [Anaerolineae bacterium]|nr:extracellular solute-binding protein [Anaerolineae bacterium]